MMPEGLLSGMNDKEVRELIAYLAGQKQVPLPAEPSPARSEKAKSLFDGKTLDGWDQLDPPLWRVEDACLTGGDGKTKIPYNDFLCTKASYSNFVLHLKIKLTGDPKTGFINSGVQIRTQRNPTGHEVCGYQCRLRRTRLVRRDLRRRPPQPAHDEVGHCGHSPRVQPVGLE